VRVVPTDLGIGVLDSDEKLVPTQATENAGGAQQPSRHLHDEQHPGGGTEHVVGKG
jgi:hypothetical protein